VRTPAPGEPTTPVLSVDELRRLVKACQGPAYTDRRDAAIVLVLVDAGLRLGELVGLSVADVDLRARILHVAGKGTRRSGPRYRTVPMGVKATRAMDRYLRARRRHPQADLPGLWLGIRGQGALSHDGVERILHRRAAAAGIRRPTAHQLRHSWAALFRTAGGAEGDLLVLGGWRSRAMLDRYGRASAQERASEAGRKLSLADRL
jgi:integrase